MPKRSSYQERVIKDYYKNRDALAIQRLSELVTDLYLAEGKAREQVWKRITGALEKLGMKADRIEHLRKQDDPELMAKLVKDFMDEKE